MADRASTPVTECGDGKRLVGEALADAGDVGAAERTAEHLLEGVLTPCSTT